MLTPYRACSWRVSERNASVRGFRASPFIHSQSEFKELRSDFLMKFRNQDTNLVKFVRKTKRLTFPRILRKKKTGPKISGPVFYFVPKCIGLLFGRDDPTRTDDPYVPNVVRYQLRYIPMRPLRKLVDVLGETALQVGGLVFVDQTDFGKFVDHCVNFRSAFLRSFLVGCVSQVAYRVPCRLRIISVMQTAPFALANGLFCRCSVCHCFIFYILVVGRRIELLLRE